jgi:ABC-2 type transport system ATP-binding protein
MIAVHNVTKRYGAFTAVDDVSFTARQGRVTGFLGPNGAGKSTTMRIMVGLTPASRGTVTIGGHRYSDIPNPARHVGVLLDASAQHAGRTGREILSLGAATMGLPERRVDEMLELVSLSDKEAKRRVRHYSLGMRQRLGIAHALLGEPKVLILDEPANGLDPRARIELRQMINGLAARGKTVLVSSHILTELGEMCDQVGIIERGQLLAVGGVEDIRAQQQAHTSVAIRTLGDPSPLAEFLDGQELVSGVRADGGEVHLMFAGDAAAQAALLQRVVAAGHAIVEFRSKPVSLEDVFMKITTGAVQ